MPKLTEEQLSHATKMFLASDDGVEARKRVQSLTEKDAEFMFTTLDQLKAARTLDEINSFAHVKGVDPMEFLFSLASKDAEEFARLCKAREEEINRALGL